MQEVGAGNNYMSSYFPLCSTAAGQCREARDPPLAEEGSQPNLTCADLCQDAALSLQQASVKLERCQVWHLVRLPVVSSSGVWVQQLSVTIPGIGATHL